MPLNRLTFFYEQVDNGWSESIHTTSTDTASLLSLTRNYLNARMAFAHPATLCTHVRISDDQIFRDVLLDPIELPWKGQWKPSVAAEGPWTALNLRMTAAPTIQRTMFLRGIPENQIDSNSPAFTAEFATVVGRFQRYIEDTTFGIKNKDRTQKKQPIITISAAGVVQTVNPLDGLLKNDLVQLLGIPRSQVPVRQYLVSALTDPSNFTLRNWQGGAITGIGYLRRINFIITPINKTVIQAVTERRVGRPFGQLRGRRAKIR